jgi:TatD DNase family protein
MNLTDTHCHLDFDQFAGEEAAVLERAKQAGVQRVINVGTTLEASRKSVQLAEQFDNVWATVGVHPHDADKVTASVTDQLYELAQNPKVVAIGEVGFDFHYDDGPNEKEQERALLHQAAIAGDLDLPLIIHSRDAESTTIRYLQQMIKNWKRRLPGVIHCFTGTSAFAEVVLELGFFISFTAPITYPKNDELREVVKKVPMDRLMVETDAPFLAPQDKRGERNEPAYVVKTAEKVAELKGLTVEEVAIQTTDNAERLFGLPRPAAP